MVKKQQPSINLKGVQVSDPFWSKVQTLVREVVIPFQKQVLEDAVPGVEKSHAVENFRIAAGEQEGEFYGFVSCGIEYGSGKRIYFHFVFRVFNRAFGR